MRVSRWRPSTGVGIDKGAIMGSLARVGIGGGFGMAGLVSDFGSLLSVFGSWVSVLGSRLSVFGSRASVRI